MKQGVAEWYRLQLKGKVWDGLKEHSPAGWNLGKVPIGYTGQKHPHPNPIKFAEGRTKTRLIEDPLYGPVITQIYQWRVREHLGKPTIRARLAADPITCPPPGPAGWSLALVDEILSNPKYTGHQVMGRRRRKARARRYGCRPANGSGPPNPPTPPWSTWPPGTPPNGWAAGTATSATPKCPPPGPAAATSSAHGCAVPSATAA